MAPTPPRYYFAYGSSLSFADMSSRCPNSVFHSIAILRNHRWIINERGFSNVLPSPPSPSGVEDIVWGVVYSIRPFEEEMLDKSEGLPWAYSKEDMDVEAVTISEDGRSTRREVVRALVYIDRERVQESYPFPEFVLKMSEGIEEGIKRGIPRTWIDSVIRGYLVIPEETAQTETTVPSILAKGKPRTASSVSSGGKQQFKDQPDPRQINQLETLINGSSQRTTSQNKPKVYGLEHSIYANDNNAREASQPPSLTVDRPSKDTKPVCWWWKVKGACRFSDRQCQFAHYETGIPPERPGSKNAKGFAGNKDMNTPKKDWKSNPSSNRGHQQYQANNSRQRVPEPSSDQGEQSWGTMQGPPAHEASWATAPSTMIPDTRPWGDEETTVAATVPSWDGASDAPAKAGLSWADEPVSQESPRGSGPDWLASNETKGIKW